MGGLLTPAGSATWLRPTSGGGAAVRRASARRRERRLRPHEGEAISRLRSRFVRGMEEARQVRHNAGSFSQCARAMLVGALQCLVRWFPRATHALEAQRMSEADHWRLHACASALGAPESAQVTRSRPSGIMRDAPCATHEGGEWPMCHVLGRRLGCALLP